MTVVNTKQTPLQVFQQHFFDIIDEAARTLDANELDTLRQIVVRRFDSVADEVLWR